MTDRDTDTGRKEPGEHDAADADHSGPGESGVDLEDEADAEEWTFSLEEIERRESEAAAKAADKHTRSIEAGTPTIEGTLFVLLGAAIAVFVFSRLFVG